MFWFFFLSLCYKFWIFWSKFECKVRKQITHRSKHHKFANTQSNISHQKKKKKIKLFNVCIFCFSFFLQINYFQPPKTAGVTAIWSPLLIPKSAKISAGRMSVGVRVVFPESINVNCNPFEVFIGSLFGMRNLLWTNADRPENVAELMLTVQISSAPLNWTFYFRKRRNGKTNWKRKCLCVSQKLEF